MGHPNKGFAVADIKNDTWTNLRDQKNMMAETFASTSAPGEKFLPNCAATPQYSQRNSNISSGSVNPYSYGKQMFIEF